MTSKNISIIDEEDIKNLWKIFRRNWYYFVILPLLALIAAKIYIYSTTNISAASITILFNPDNSSDISEVILRGLGVQSRNKNIANEMYVLTSSSLVREILDKLNLDVSYYIIGRAKTTEVYGGVPFQVKPNIINPEYYNFPFNLTIIDNTKYSLMFEKQDTKYEKIHYFGEEIVTKDYSIVINKTNPLARDFNTQVLYMFKVNNKNALVNKYKASLEVTNFEWTGVIEISLQDAIANRAVDFLDTLATEYIEQSILRQQEVNSKTIELIDKLLDDVVNELNIIEIRLENFKKDNVSLNLTEEQSHYITKLTSYNAEADNLEIELQLLNYLYDHILINKENIYLTPSLIGQPKDAILGNYLNRLFELQRKRNDLLFDNEVNSPTVKDVDTQITKLKDLAISHLLSSKRAIKDRINTISEYTQAHKDFMKTIPGIERELINIQRKREVNEKIYLYLLEKKAETIIAKASIVSDRNVIESAKSQGIISPDKQKIYYTYVGIGLIISFLIIFIKRIFFNTIDSKEDLEALTNMPILGVIGRSKDSKDEYLVVESKPKSAITEAFRSIRTNFEYLSPEVKNKMILITSYMAKEGKTFSTVNIAAILAKADKRVLIMELDLHHPQISIALGVSNHVGISSYLIDKATSKEIIKHTESKNLDYILAGSVPPNPSELIISNKLKKLLLDLKPKYDYIIIDTPPIGIITDALIIMKMTDINLYVLRASYAKKEFVKIAHQIKENNNPKNMGFILNGVKGSFLKYGYGYGYNYGGYG